MESRQAATEVQATSGRAGGGHSRAAGKEDLAGKEQQGVPGQVRGG